LLIIFSMDNHVDHSNHQNRESTNVGNNHLFGHAMTFHFGLNEVILFSFWSVNGLTAMIASCIIIIFLCFIMEIIRLIRSIRICYERKKEESNTNAIWKISPQVNFNTCIDSFLHAIQLTISYLLMLLFMTFNVWICLAVIGGEVMTRFCLKVIFRNIQIAVRFFFSTLYKLSKIFSIFFIFITILFNIYI
uniref:Copper transport protein n=1 Tax=Dracunculus medinensis TaxID=318479 RepID=A0A0N4U384_DRAME